MSGPALVNQTVWAGDDTPPLVWGFGEVGASEIPAGAEFRLDIGWCEPRAGIAPGSLAATSPDGGLVVDRDAGTVTWSYSVAQSSGIPQGAIARYQLRCLLDDKTQTWAYGAVIVRKAVP